MDTIIGIIVQGFNALTAKSKGYILQSLTTCIMLLVLYASWNIMHEGTVLGGLQAAFWEDKVHHKLQEAELEAIIGQAELRNSVRVNHLVELAMRKWLETSSSASRVRLAIIHNGVYGLSGSPLLRFDLVQAVTAPGHTTGELKANIPLTEWAQFLPEMLAGKCTYMPTSEIKSQGVRERMDGFGAQARLDCPVIDLTGRLVGALLMTWDRGIVLPTPEEIDNLKVQGVNYGSQLAQALSFLGRYSAMPEYSPTT